MSFTALVPVINSVKIEPNLIATKQGFSVKASVIEESATLFYVQNYSGEISAGQGGYPKWPEYQTGTVYLDGTAPVNGDGTPAYPYNDIWYAVEKAGENGTVIVIGDVILPG